MAGERITAVGDLSAERGRTEVDGRGLALAPGFIDVHSHDDLALFVTPDMDFKIGQGVTTVVVGNCGFGAAPRSAGRGSMGLLDASARREPLPEWDGYGDYLDAIDADPPSVNAAVLVGHGTVRFDAMGNERRQPTDAEQARMVDVLAEGVAAGCVGLSTGLIYEPGRYSSTEEIVSLASVMAGDGGVYASHMRNEADRLLDAVAETIRVGEEAGVPVQISHHKASGRSSWGLVRRSLALIDEARERGDDVTADQYPYTAASTSLAAVLQNHEEGAAGLGATEWSDVVLASAPVNPHWEGSSLAEVGRTLGVGPVEAARRIVDSEGYGAIAIVHSMSDDDVRTVMAHPSTMIGTDGIPTIGGRPHPRLYGAFARVLGRYVREERVLSLAEAVHRMSGLPAHKFDLAGRGVIEAGAWADLVLLDPARVDDVATYESPRQHPAGIRGVWVNGTRVISDGVHPGNRPGRAVRRGPAR